MTMRVDEWLELVLGETQRESMLRDRPKSYTEKLLRFKDYTASCKNPEVLER